MSRRNTFVDAVESVKNKIAIKNGYKITFLPWRRRVNLILPLSYHQILVKRLHKKEHKCKRFAWTPLPLSLKIYHLVDLGLFNFLYL